MKKLLCVLCLVFSLSFSVSAFAESFITPTEDEEILHVMNRIALASDFSYERLSYDDERHTIYIDFSEYDFAETISDLLEQGYDETCDEWAEFREALFGAYKAIISLCADSGRNDVNVILNFLNDDIYIREESSVLPDSTFLSFRDGEVWFDIMQESSLGK